MKNDSIPEYQTLSKCVCCDDDKLKLVLDLGKQPLANSYHKPEEILPEYPLAMNVCTVCFHCQQAVAINPDLMFKNYAYVSGTSETLREYFDEFAQKINDDFGKSNKRVLDIACNDGSQLKPFIARGWNAWGVDPAENLIDRARETGAQIICDYWTQETAIKLEQKFDILIAQNVFAHTAEPLQFLLACKEAMHEKSKLFIQTSQADMIKNGEFDTIYHEHISFFSTKSLLKLAEQASFVIENISTVPVHGGSYVFKLGFDKADTSIETRFEEERQQGRYELQTYKEFGDKARQTVYTLAEHIKEYKSAGWPIVGYGAAAKGNTLLNFGKIKLDYIVDDNPLKQGLLTPGMNISIRPSEILKKEGAHALIIPLAWNFFEEIKNRVRSMRPSSGDAFITYFPNVFIR